MKRIEIDTFLKFQFLSSPQFSPDGTKIAFTVSVPDLGSNGYLADLYLYDLETKSVSRITAGGDAKTWAWTPDNTLLFSAARTEAEKRDKENGITHLYEISPSGGEAVCRASVPAVITGIHLLPDGRYLLTIRHDNYKDTRKKSYEVFDELPFWGNGQGYTNAKRNRYAVYDLKSGDLTYVDDEWTNCSQYSVFGNLLLYKAYPWKQSVMGIRPGVYLYDLATGEKVTLIVPDSIRTGVVSLLDEKTAIIAATDDSYKDTTKYCDFYRMNLADGSMELIHPYESSIGISSVGSDSRFGSGQTFKAVNGEFYYVSTVGDFSHLYKISRDGTVSDPLTEGSSCDSFDLANGHIASMEFCGMQIAELFVDGVQVTHMNDWLTEEYDVRTPEAFTFTASDGYEIHGWVLKPAGYEEEKSYPGILNIHGGPRTVYSDVYYHEMQMWANRGYFVFFCNPRGSDGRGTDFGNINGLYGTVDYQNLMDFTDEVLKRYPMIDASRLGVAGGSYGGFMTNWIIGHTDRFHAAASQRSISNWVSFEHNSDIGHTFILNNQGGNTRTNVELLWKQSPLQFAPNCKTPTLFIHSDEDYRCYMAEGIAMFSAIKRNGCPAKLCLFHGENHELSRSGKPENRIDRMREIIEWMDTYLR
nr:S9 family peptidase [Clostridium sp. OF09-10]